ncbi:hypothetical protein SPI_04970 [Niveomyces insectorum RCEF 264]|uniref:Kinetochore protein fta7 n=1 Tax=Niveomyces insectorum RCEF 264 TaxID=1081102 RepID=A0A167TU23_9HYPO|nr:hypothetical protein SPI_04970 [Niveomyces insectorum RCEF 264]
MAPDNQKRKRGRPPHASVTDDASSPKPAASRPKGAASQKNNAEASTTAGPVKSRKRARLSADDEDRDSSGEPGRRRRSARDRNSGDGSNWWQATSSPNGDPSKPNPAKTGKPAKTPAAAAEPAKRGPGRPSIQAAAVAPGASASASTKRRPGRPSLETIAPQIAQTGGADERQARGTAKRRRTGGPEASEQREKHGADDAADGVARSQTRTTTTTTARTKTPAFPQLVPRTRLISTATINSKWGPLEPDAIAAVQSLLAECAQPILAQWGGTSAGSGSSSTAAEHRHEQARQALAGVTRRLRAKLTKGLAFPPGTVAANSTRGTKRTTKSGSKAVGRRHDAGLAADFDFERTVAGVRALEQQLTPLQHAAALLERTRARETRALAADYAALRQLDTNAQAELRTWRARARRAHVLAPVDDDDPASRAGGALLPRQVELVKQPAAGDDETDDERVGLFENTDKDFLSLATQLSNHMDSLQGNLQQIDGVVPAIAQSKAALRQVLHQHFDPEQYERIVLGS